MKHHAGLQDMVIALTEIGGQGLTGGGGKADAHGVTHAAGKYGNAHLGNALSHVPGQLAHVNAWL